MSEEIVNYFQRVLSGKMEKGDWLISLILFGSIFVLSCWKGGPVGGFTFILAIATIWNIRITQGLLRRSETSFAIDTIDRMMNYVNQNTTKLGIDTVVNYTIARLMAIHKVNKELSDVLWEALIAWGSEAKYKEFADRLGQFRSRNSTRTGKEKFDKCEK